MKNTSTASQQPQQTAALETASDREQIAERAYYRYLERGRADGRALDDWLDAETELRQQVSPRGE
jgi:hypothetical protein